jgi:hypothetical protein
MNFKERLKLVAGDRPYEWAEKPNGIGKPLMTSLMRLKGRPQTKSIDKLVAATGIPAEWWLHGEGPPPGAGAVQEERASAFRVPAGERRMMGVSSAELAYTADSREVDTGLWDNCFRACQQVHGAEFSALPASQQSAYANDLYNLVVKMAAQTGRSVKDAHRLEVVGMADLLRVFGRMGWARRFPDRRCDLPGVVF